MVLDASEAKARLKAEGDPKHAVGKKMLAVADRQLKRREAKSRS
jgi:hypothetical protein